MLPRNSVHDCPNGSLRDAEHIRQSTLGPQRIIRSNITNIVVSQNGFCVFHAVRSPGAVIASLRHHVVYVFELSTEPQVGWVHAPCAITSGAIVQHFTALGYRSKMKNPACPVSEYDETPTADPSIAVRHSAASPKPARFGNCDFGKKPSWEAFRKSLREVRMLNKVLHSSVSLPAEDFRSQRAF